MSGNAPHRILIADDHAIVRFGLRELINGHPGFAVVGEATNGAEALQLARELAPDIVVLDVRMPDGDGVDACRQILAALPGTRVLMLTSFSDDQAVMGAIRAGASGYVLKHLGTGSLLEALTTIAQGGSLLDPAVTGCVLAQMKNLSRNAGGTGLTPQEERILALVGAGLTNREIAGELGLSEHTVRNYVSTILAKLGVATRSQAAVYAVRNNLVPEPTG